MEKPSFGVLAELTRPIIGAAIEVHRELGPGLMKSAYEECLWAQVEFVLRSKDKFQYR